MLKHICTSLVLAFLISAVAEAQTILRVPSNYPTIQAAINAAQTGNTIRVAPGTYVESINFNGKAITLVSEAGADVTVIDGNATDTVVRFLSSETRASVLDGFTIRNGKGAFTVGGGGILIGSASPTIRNNHIVNNVSCNGAGIEIAGSSSTLIQGNTISNNITGGCSGGTGGGGILLSSTKSVEILDNLIANNAVPTSAGGGGISVNGGGTPLIRGNTIIGNSAIRGGGLSLSNFSDAAIIQNLIAGNSAQNGAGIYWSVGGTFSQASITNNSIVDNDGTILGSGVYFVGLSGLIPIKNNLIAGKTSQTAFYCETVNSSNPPAFAFNNITSDQGAALGGVCPAVIGVTGNISSPPLLVNRALGNYRYSSGSPGIDAGDKTQSNLQQKDLDAFPRVLPVGGQLDMGAYEFVDPTTATISISALAFANQDAGTISAPQDVTLTNTGTSVLFVNSISIGGEFQQSNACQISSGIAGGQSCTFSVRFAPVSGGSSAGQLGISTNAGTFVVSLSGTGTLTLNNAFVSFVDQRVGTTSSPMTVTLSNNGSASIGISNIAITGDFIGSNNCPATLVATFSCTITIQFSPSLRGLLNGVVTINSSIGLQFVFLSGRGLAPTLTIPSSSVQFPNQALNTPSAVQSVTVTNQGDVPLVISSFSFTGDFSGSHNCGSSLAVNASCIFSLTFTPTAFGTRNGTLTVFDDAVGGPHTISLGGTSNGGVITPNFSSLDFGIQAISTTSSGKLVILRNTGNTSLGISSVTVSGEFSKSGGTLCTTLSPNSICTMTIAFVPITLGQKNGAITIVSSAFGSPTVIPLTGVSADIVFAPAALTFASDLVGTSSPAKVVTLANAKSFPVAVAPISISGDFFQTTNCGSTLAVGASCTVNVTFAPAQGGTRTGTLSVMVDGVNQVVSLSGTGLTTLPVPGIVSISPDNRPTGTSDTTVTVNGSGFSSLSVVRWGGADRPTVLVDNSTLTVTIPSSDFTALGAFGISVFNPTPGGGMSNSASFTVYRAITLSVKDLIYDRVGNRIYGSVGSSAPSLANTLAPLDPVSGVIGTPISIGTDPGKLAISDDSRLIYVALDGPAQIRSYDTALQTPGTPFGLGQNVTWGFISAEDISVSPGQPQTVAVSGKYASVSPRHAGVSIYDNGVKRPTATPDHIGSNLIEYASPSTLYGYDMETIPAGFRTMTVNSSGVTITKVVSELISSVAQDMKFDAGRIYATNGQIIDPAAGTLLGTLSFPSGGEVRGIAPDSTLRLIFVLYPAINSVRILAYDQNTFLQVGSLTLPGPSNTATLGSLIRWGDSGLAYRAGTQVYTLQIPSSWIASSPAPITLSPSSGQQGQSNITVAASGIGTNLIQGQTSANFGAGITVNAVTVTDAQHATFNVSIATGAAIGPRLVTITSAGTVATAVDPFNVSGVPGSVTSWGFDAGLPSNPLGTFKAIAAGDTHSLAIQSDGTLIGWGSNSNGQTNVPPGTYIAIAAGNGFSLAIRSDGTLAGWGNNSQGQTSVPTGTFKAVAAGSNFGLAIRTDGTLAGWGVNDAGQTNVPSGAFIVIAAGNTHSLGIRSDGTLAGWGSNSRGQTNVQAGLFTAIAAGGLHSLAIRTDGTLAGWGDNSFGQIDVPSGTFTAVAAGDRNSFAIRTNGRLVGWGDNSAGNVPGGTFKAISARGQHGITVGTTGQAAPRDFSGKGSSDILWRDGAGNVSIGQVNGTTVIGTTTIAQIWLGWSIAGSGDFNGDGKTDILWRDISGNIAVWLMDGTTVSTFYSLGNQLPEFTVAAVADFNGDGIADILWRRNNGDVAIWLLNNFKGINANFIVGNIWPGWTIVGTGDFNADGKADVLWRNNSGDVAVWLMNGLTVVSSNLVSNASAVWSIAGIADFNGDGRADILWRDTDGNVSIWLMNGSTLINGPVIASIWPGWSIAGTGDFNGDGKADILWRNGSGDVSMWLMDGTNVLSWAALGNVSDRIAQ